MSAEQAAYLDPTRSVEDRVGDLLTRMDPAEKIGQMLMLYPQDDLPELVVDRGVGAILHTRPDQIAEASRLVAQTRLQVPLLIADDCIHGHSFWPGATIFPTQLAMACAWDADLVERIGRATAVEASSTGLHWTFSPVLCVTRDLRWGRVGETFGEDPFLIGELGSAMIRGYQADGLSDPTAVLACAKHFAGYSETQGGRDASESDLTPRKLRSWFLPPFERAAREGCRTFMLGYQAIDGTPVTINSWLLDEVLKREWGYTGTLVTDWDNVGRMVWEMKIMPDHVKAAAAAIRAGNDIIMTTPDFLPGALAALDQGLVTEDQLDACVARVLRLKFELGLFEDPRLPDTARQEAVIGCAEHTDLNLEAARRSLVLLRNDGTLPLAVDGVDDAGRATSTTSCTIAVIGPNADDPRAVLGDWAGASGQATWMADDHPRALVETVLDGVRSVTPSGWQVTHARGADIEVLVPDPSGETWPDGQPRAQVFSPAPLDDALLAEAVAVAQSADVVIAVLGDTIALTGETRSTATLDLQGGQVALLDALVATGTPVVLVLLHSKPAALPPSAFRTAAIVEGFNPGMRGGRAVAELLLGLVEPSGRLPVSVPRHVGQQPTYYNQVRGQHGDRYADLTQEPAFVFGEGLSYSNVDYSELTLDDDALAIAATIHATVTLTNTGTRAVLETVQVYVRDRVTSATWADKELKAFRQVHLEPGSTRTVEIDVPVAECTIVDASGLRLVEPGEFELLVGPSSRDRDLLTAGFVVF